MRAMQIAQINHIRLMRYAGLFTYVSAGMPLLRYESLVNELIADQRPLWHLSAWVVCYAAFGAVFWLLLLKLGSRRYVPLKLALLVVLVTLAVAIGWYSQSGLSAMLLVVQSMLLPWLMPLRVALICMVAQNYVLVPVFASNPGWTIGDAILQSSLYLGISALVFFTYNNQVAQVVANQEMLFANGGTTMGTQMFVDGLAFVEYSPWIESLGISYHLAVDGLSAPMVLLREPELAAAIDEQLAGAPATAAATSGG